ncbi:P-loop containing nucleoside triphosphate hydrolase protein [Xylaria telfairii]|nr:P-loop containing nucleoside triphosphate hydrolase protein [Xylaria telfairii]
MLPVIFLVGSTSSGKGTLGQRLAAEFNLHHISLGETYRALDRARRKPIPSMPHEINTYLVSQKEIPETVLAQFKPGHIPVVLQLHNYTMRNSKRPNLSGGILRERIAYLLSERSILPRAIIVDALRGFAPSFSGLTIHIVCPKNVARSRYLRRARSGNSNVEKFEERMLKYEVFMPRFLNMLKSEGVVVETVNDDTMTIDEAYRVLLKHLDEVPLWRAIIEMSPPATGS